MLTLLQAIVRGHRSRVRTAHQREVETGAAVVVQRWYRGCETRRRLRLRRLHAAAVVVQRWWRGEVARAAVHREWLDGKVRVCVCVRACVCAGSFTQTASQATSIQRLMRGHLARVRTRAMSERMHTAAKHLQKSFRAQRVRVCCVGVCGCGCVRSCVRTPPAPSHARVRLCWCAGLSHAQPSAVAA